MSAEQLSLLETMMAMFTLQLCKQLGLNSFSLHLLLSFLCYNSRGCFLTGSKCSMVGLKRLAGALWVAQFIEVLKTDVTDLGYKVASQIVDSQKFVVRQRRNRLYACMELDRGLGLADFPSHFAATLKSLQTDLHFPMEECFIQDAPEVPPRTDRETQMLARALEEGKAARLQEMQIQYWSGLYRFPSVIHRLFISIYAVVCMHEGSPCGYLEIPSILSLGVLLQPRPRELRMSSLMHLVQNPGSWN